MRLCLPGTAGVVDAGVGVVDGEGVEVDVVVDETGGTVTHAAALSTRSFIVLMALKLVAMK